MTQIIEIVPRERPGPFYPTQSILWLLMTGRRMDLVYAIQMTTVGVKLPTSHCLRLLPG